MISSVSVNPYSTSLAGMQRAQTQLDQASATIADPGAAADTVSLSEAAVSMKQAEMAFKASAMSFKAESEALGTLIDITA